MKLELLKDEYFVYKFDPNHKINPEIPRGDFFSITKSKDELSVVAGENTFNDYIKAEPGWKILKIDENLDFGLVGVISGICTILANEKISVFVISTFNTDYIMIKKKDLQKTLEILRLNHYEAAEK